MKDGHLNMIVNVQPGATSDQIVEVNKNSGLSIQVTAPPRPKEENSAVCALIAKTLQVKKEDVNVELGDETR
jgi:uncharacterized protein YggU (UPF0235/DUF167 family)